MRTLFLICISSILTGCYQSEEVSNEVIIRKSNKFSYEIELPIYVEGRGNMHNMNLSKYKFVNSYWIYSNSAYGKLDTSQFVITNHHEKTEYPWSQRNLKGYIEIYKDSLLINLKLPRYPDGVTLKEWSNFRYNGVYKIRRQLDE